MNNGVKGVLLYGFGGHARSIADVSLASGIETLLFVDSNARQNETFAGFPVMKEMPSALPEDWIAFPAAGGAVQRQAQLEDIKRRGWRAGCIVSATATLGVLSTLGAGCFVGHHAHVGPSTRIGDGAIINSGAVVEHDCQVGSFTHISVNGTVAGGTIIGDGCFIGAGSTVINSLKIGHNITLGAGGCFIKDVSEPGTYAGTPAKRIK